MTLCIQESSTSSTGPLQCGGSVRTGMGTHSTARSVYARTKPAWACSRRGCKRERRTHTRERLGAERLTYRGRVSAQAAQDGKDLGSARVPKTEAVGKDSGAQQWISGVEGARSAVVAEISLREKLPVAKVVAAKKSRLESSKAKVAAIGRRIDRLVHEDLPRVQARVEEQKQAVDFEREQAKLKAETRAAKRLRRVAVVQSENVEQNLKEALDRLQNIEQMYLAGTPLERRVLNRAIFKYVEVGEEGEVTGTALTPVYEALTAWEPGLGQPWPDRGNLCSVYVRPSSGTADQ